MRGGDQGEGVGVCQQAFQAGRVIEELDQRVLQDVPTPEQFPAEGARAPGGAIVREHGEAGDGAVVALEDSTVVGEHAFGEGAVVAALDLDVDVDPVLRAVQAMDADQLVDEALAQFSVLDNLGQFLVEKLVTTAPVDCGVGVREVEGEELRKVVLQGVLPGGVVVGRGGGLVGALGHG